MFWLKANFRGLEKKKKILIGCRVAIENKFIKKKNLKERMMCRREKGKEEDLGRIRGLEKDSPSSSPVAFLALGGGKGVAASASQLSCRPVQDSALAGRSRPAQLPLGEQR